MRTRLGRSVFAALLVMAFVAGRAEAVEKAERVAASFVLAQGRAPRPEEQIAWARESDRSFAELLARHRQQLRSDAGARRAVELQAWRDAFGREPDAKELAAAGADAGRDEARDYTALMEGHRRWLAGRPADYTAVIERAYRQVLGRAAFAEEHAYWRARGTLTFVLLVGSIEDWARRNAPGLTLTAGNATVSMHSRFLTTVRLSVADAAEARAAAGLLHAGDAALAAAVGRHVLAAGTDHVITGGGIHFAAAGRGELAREISAAGDH